MPRDLAAAQHDEVLYLFPFQAAEGLTRRQGMAQEALNDGSVVIEARFRQASYLTEEVGVLAAQLREPPPVARRPESSFSFEKPSVGGGSGGEVAMLPEGLIGNPERSPEVLFRVVRAAEPGQRTPKVPRMYVDDQWRVVLSDQ